MADPPHYMPYSNHNGTNQQPQQNNRFDNSSIHSNQSQQQLQQPEEEEDSSGQVKSLRPMLARGAACDTCRARKVKCDASRPYCSPCLKSARGNTTIAASKCAYEGTSVAIATANRAAEIQKQGGVKRKRRATKGGVKEEDGGEIHENRKRKKAPSAEEDERGNSRGSSRSLGEEEGFSQPRPQYPAQIPSVFMDPSSGYQVPLPSASNSSSEQSLPPSYNRMQHPNSGNGPWQSTRPLDSAYPTPASRYQMPPNSNGDRYSSSKLEEETNEAGEDKEQLADRVAELERQLKLQADSHAATLAAGRQPGQGPLAPPLPHAAFNAAYGSPAPGARSPSFPYATYSAYAPPPPSYGPYGSNYNNNGSPSASSFLPGSSQNPLSHSTSSSSASVAASQYPPIQLPPPPNTASPYGSNPPLPLPLSHLQSQMNPIDNRRRSLSTLSAIAGAVSMEEYPPIGGSGTNSPLSTWSAHHLQGQDSYGGGYRFSTSSPVSSTRHLGMSEPQAFALTSSVSSPGRTNWNTTTSSLRTSYENPPQDAQADQRIPTPPTATSSSNHSTSNSTSPSTTLPPSVEAGPSDPSISLNSSTNAANPIYYEPFDLGQSMFPLLDLSYPATLPPLSVLHHLISTFFKRAAVPSTMLSKAKLLFHLSLSPNDCRWPDEALLHAICAYACMYVSDESLGGGEYGGLGLNASGGGLGGMRMRYWEVEGDQTARDYHYKKAKVAIEEALSLTRGNKVGRNLFQVLQAVVLVCYVAYLSAQFTDLWLLAGTATRLIAPLGLNHLEPWDFDRNRSGPAYQDWGIRVRKTERNELLGPVKNLAEHWERSVTFWLAFAVDRFASANTDWTTSIDEKDISTHLPCTATQPMPGLSIDPQLCHIPSLYHGSPSFLEDTSAPIGSLGLYIKATILLGRVVNYTQRFPRYLMIPMGGSCSSIKRDIKATPEFVELDLAISKYKASNSANFFDNAGSSIDGFLASAYVIPHVATILLHETLTDRYDRTPQSSIQRCLVAAKCIINSTYILYQSSYDLGGVDPFLPFCWSVAGRALVRDFTTRQYWGETDEAASSRQLAEHCLSFTQHCAKQGSRIAQRLTETLEKHLENPESLLPLDAGCGVVFDLGDAAASHAYGMSEEERRRELASMGSLPTYA